MSSDEHKNTSQPSSSSQVILHDPTKQKIVLYDPRSQQIRLCQSRWYETYNNDEPVNIQFDWSNFNNRELQKRTFQICPMCHQQLPSIYQSLTSATSIPPTLNMPPTLSLSTTSHHMHRDYFALLDRSYTNSRQSSSTRSSVSSINSDIDDLDSKQEIDTDALNSGYYKKFFKKVEKLGSGSYGTVHLVNHVMHDISLGLFAVKIVCVGDKVPRLVEMLREVRALQRLHHRNVIDYKHSWLENYQPAITGPLVPTLFILMEYADRGNIMDYVLMDEHSKPKWLSEHEIWTIMFETCMGLQHLHEEGIVHRDLKPNNLLMTSLHTRHRIDFEDLELYDTHSRIVLSDLGQSEFLDMNERLCSRTGNTGTLGYAAPELVLGSEFNINEWDESVDIWSVGHILYFLAFSKWPYEGYTSNEIELYSGIVNGKYKLLIPKNNGFRSDTIIQMIDELCCINSHKRPSLNWIIDRISNILRKHEYITVQSDSDTHKDLALPPPQSFQSKYPIVKYVPKEKRKLIRKKSNKKLKKRVVNSQYKNGGNLLRRRVGKNTMNASLLMFCDNKYDKLQKTNDLCKVIDESDIKVSDDHSESERKKEGTNVCLKNKNGISKKKTIFEMTLFATVEQPFKYVMSNGTVQMSLCLMLKMELIFKYIPITNENGYVWQIYASLCLLLLSVLCNNSSSHNIGNACKRYVVILYGLLSVVSYLYALTVSSTQNDSIAKIEEYESGGGVMKRIFILFALEMILLSMFVFHSF